MSKVYASNYTRRERNFTYWSFDCFGLYVSDFLSLHLQTRRLHIVNCTVHL